MDAKPMTQPNDTQAPDTIWAIRTGIEGAVAVGSWADTVRYHGGTEYVSATVAAAQTAAAWLAGRDAVAARMIHLLNGCADANEKTYPDYARDMREWADDVDREAKALPLPDGQAALDALIAERVREAEHAGWIRAAKAIKGILAIPQPGTVPEIIDDLIASRIDAARASKEGRDG